MKKNSVALVALMSLLALPAFAAAGDISPAEATSTSVCALAEAVTIPETMPDPQLMSPVYCEASCQAGTVSCTGNVSCSAVDANCPGQRGYVVCDGVYTYCTQCPTCDEGDIKIVVGGCCDYGKIERERYRCIGSQWVLEYSECSFSPRCPL